MVLVRYRRAKSRLKAAVPSLQSLRGHARGSSAAGIQSCLQEIEQLSEVLRLVFVGATGSGRSRLMSVLKAEAAGFLRCDAVDAGEGAATAAGRQLLERADGILCVLDALHPWSADTWRFLGGLQAPLRSRVMLVVQRCDLRDKGELAPVLRHISGEAGARLGCRCQVVAVSARWAEASRGDSADPGRLRQASGIDELGDALTAVLQESSGCMATLQRALDEGDKALQSLRHEIGEVAVEMKETDAARSGIERLAQGMLEQMGGRAGPVLTTADRGIMDAIVAAEKQLLAAAQERGGKDAAAVAAELQRALQAGIDAAVDAALDEAVRILEQHLARSWDHVASHLREHHFEAFREKDLKPVPWRKQRGRFLEAARQRLTPARDAVLPEEAVASQLARPPKARRVAVATTLALAAGAAAAAAFGHWIPAAASGLAAAAPFVLQQRWSSRWRARATRSLWDSLDAHREHIEQALSAVITHDSCVYAGEFQARVASLGDQAAKFLQKLRPVLTDYEEAAAAFTGARALLDHADPLSVPAIAEENGGVVKEHGEA